jgi:hypothetical protein
MLNPYIDAIPLDRLLQYGPPLGLAALGSWLFFKTSVSKRETDKRGFLENPKPQVAQFASGLERDVSLLDTIWRAHLGRWEARQTYERANWVVEKPFFDLVTDVRQKAFEGKLPVWGRRPRSDLFEPIPPEFWRNHEVTASYVINPLVNDTWVSVTHPLVVGEVAYAKTSAWEDFMTNRGTVEKLWPQMSSVKQNSNTKTSEYAYAIPDLRMADDVAAWGLLESSQRDKLLPLLEGGKIEAWGRLGNGHPPLMKIPSDLWRTNYLVRYPAPIGGISQTFLKSKARHETTYYDVYLNRAQLERVWPNLWSEVPLDRIPCTELLNIAAAAGWDFSSLNSLDLLDLQDAMRQGGSDDRLTIWGKRKKWTSDELMRKELLEKIEPEHWKGFFIHLHAAAQDDNFNTYSWAPDQNDFGRRGYVDLHIDRSQATSWLNRDASFFRGKTALEGKRRASSPIELPLERALESKPLAPSLSGNSPESVVLAYSRDVSLYDAICRMFLGRWEKILIKDGLLDLSQSGFQAIHDLMDHVRQLAFDDRLPIWGKKQGHQSLWEKPPAAFWKNNHLDYLSFTDSDPTKLRVVPSNTSGQTTSLCDLMTSRAAVDAICQDQSIASTLPTNDANSLCIVTGTGEPFDHVEVNQYGVHHTISVGIKNVGSKKITNCNFYRTYVGFTGDSQKTLLDGPFSLDPNEIRYLSAAMFNETKDLPHANHLMGLSLSPGAFGAGIMVPRLPPDRRHVLSFVAESVDARNAVLHCEVLVSDAGKLRLEIL